MVKRCHALTLLDNLDCKNKKVGQCAKQIMIKTHPDKDKGVSDNIKAIHREISDAYESLQREKTDLLSTLCSELGNCSKEKECAKL